jgi:hypothetical protein
LVCEGVSEEDVDAADVLHDVISLELLERVRDPLELELHVIVGSDHQVV